MKYKIIGFDKYSNKSIKDLYDIDSISDYLETIDEYKDLYEEGYVMILDHVGSMGESKSDKIRKERDKKIDIIINDGK